MTKDGNFGASRDLLPLSASKFDQTYISSNYNNDKRLEAYDKSINGYFSIGRKSSGEIFKKKNRDSKSFIETNYSANKMRQAIVENSPAKLELSVASFDKTMKSLVSSRETLAFPGTSSKSILYSRT